MCESQVSPVNSPRPFLCGALILKAITPLHDNRAGHTRLELYYIHCGLLLNMVAKYDHMICVFIRCLHDWMPHSGNAVSRLMFCDNLLTSDPKWAVYRLFYYFSTALQFTMKSLNVCISAIVNEIIYICIDFLFSIVLPSGDSL